MRSHTPGGGRNSQPRGPQAGSRPQGTDSGGPREPQRSGDGAERGVGGVREPAGVPGNSFPRGEFPALCVRTQPSRTGTAISVTQPASSLFPHPFNLQSKLVPAPVTWRRLMPKAG